MLKIDEKQYQYNKAIILLVINQRQKVEENVMHDPLPTIL
jgi:hypothetical protein